MSRNKKWVSLFTGGLLVLAAALAALLVVPHVGQAAEAAAPSGPWIGGRGWAGPDDTYLANALGITAEELTAAQQAASATAIQKAVDEGLLTEEQAESLQNNERFSGRMFFPMMRGGFGATDHEALLAETLDIEVEALREAYAVANAAANEARLSKAVEDGRLTQEQVDLMEAGKNLRQYFQDNGFFADAVQKAVDAGVIAQAQANVILEQMDSGMRGFGRMPGGMRDFGHMPDFEGMWDRGEMPDLEGMRDFRGRGKFGGFGGRLPQDRPMRGVSPDTSGA